MMKKVVTSILILAVGLTIISGAVLAKDQIIEYILPEEVAIGSAAIGETGGLTGDGTQSSGLKGETSFEAQPVQYLPEAEQSTQFEGTIAALDSDDKMFDLSIEGSGVTAFYVSPQTSFEGDLSSFGDLSADMQVSVSAVQNADGKWQVVSLAYEGAVEDQAPNGDEQVPEPEPNGDGEPKQDHLNMYKMNVGGRVTSVGADTLTIQTKDNQPMTFAIGESTLFNSHIGSHDSLDDIKVNFTVAVIYFEGEMLNGHRLAYRVVVANEGIAFNPYQQGWVDSVGADQFTITTNQGATYTFMVDASTQVKGVGSFAEMAAGMRAFVYYQDMGGTLLAKGIQVWP